MRLDNRETATVLAALRATQNVQEHEALAPEIETIRTDGGTLEPLTAGEIDALCERINCDDGSEPLAHALTLLRTAREVMEGEADNPNEREWQDAVDALFAGHDAQPTEAEEHDREKHAARQRRRSAAEPKVSIRCKHCGSGNVRRDAWAVWNATTQVWELGEVFDAGHCEDCEGESRLVEWPVEIAERFDEAREDIETLDGDNLPDDLKAIRAEGMAAYEAAP